MRQVFGIVVLFGVLACGGPPASPNPPAAVPAGVPTAPPGWVTAHYWLGAGARDTETFTTRRGEWRLAWRSTREPHALIMVQVVHADSQAVVTTAMSSVAEGGATTMVRAPAGRYFVRVQSLALGWAVAVEESR